MASLPLSSTTITINFSSNVGSYWTTTSAGSYTLFKNPATGFNYYSDTIWADGAGSLHYNGPNYHYGLVLIFYNSLWQLVYGYNDDGAIYFDQLYFHPNAPNTSIPTSGWVLGNTGGTPTTGGTLTIS